MWLVKNFKQIVVKDQLTQNIFKKWAWKLISGLTGSCVLSSLISFLLKSTSFPPPKKTTTITTTTECRLKSGSLPYASAFYVTMVIKVGLVV